MTISAMRGKYYNGYFHATARVNFCKRFRFPKSHMGAIKARLFNSRSDLKDGSLVYNKRYVPANQSLNLTGAE